MDNLSYLEFMEMLAASDDNEFEKFANHLEFSKKRSESNSAFRERVVETLSKDKFAVTVGA